MNNKIVVTRHKGLVEYLKETGLINEETPVLEHATREDVLGKHVIGVLPLSLACYAKKITEVPLPVPRELRGKELSLEEVRALALEPVTYIVTKEE